MTGYKDVHGEGQKEPLSGRFERKWDRQGPCLSRKVNRNFTAISGHFILEFRKLQAILKTVSSKDPVCQVQLKFRLV